MKKVLKGLLIVLVLLLFSATVFIVLLAFNEYRPDDVTELDVYEVTDTNLVSLDTDIKVLTFNTGYASLSETEDFVMDGGVKAKMDTEAEVQANVDGIIEIIQQQDADITMLQEVDVDSKRSYYIDQLDAYQDALSQNSVFAYNYRCIFVPFPVSTQAMGEVNSGVATFADYSIESATRIQAPGSAGWPMQLAHLKRCFLISRYNIDGSDKQLIVINVHLSAYDDGERRAEETAALLSTMTEETSKGNYVVVGGDFNQALPGSYTEVDNETTYTYPILETTEWFAPPIAYQGFLDNDFTFYADITTPTCRLLDKPLDKVNDELNQYYVIDGFIVSSNVTVDHYETVDAGFEYSDHNPVAINITLNS